MGSQASKAAGGTAGAHARAAAEATGASLFQVHMATLRTAAVNENDGDPKARAYWAEFWSLCGPGADPLAQLSVDTVRSLVAHAPRNLALLVRKLVQRLELGVRQGEALKPHERRFLENALRILTRIMPVVHENESNQFEKDVFWDNLLPIQTLLARQSVPHEGIAAATTKENLAPGEKGKEPATGPVSPADESVLRQSSGEEDDLLLDEGDEAEHPGQALIDEALSDMLPGPTDVASRNAAPIDPLAGIPLAVRLVRVLQDLLFLPGFTIGLSPSSKVPDKTKTDAVDEENGNEGDLSERLVDDPLDNSSVNLIDSAYEQVWAAGVRVERALPSNAEMNAHRSSVLQCLIACVSRSLYLDPIAEYEFQNPWLDELTSHKHTRSYMIFLSLLNAGLSYDPIGWGVPYNHVMFADPQYAVSELSLQMLSILLHHKSLDVSPKAPDNGALAKPRNVYVQHLQSVSQDQDFEFLCTALKRLLNNPIRASTTYLPNSTRSIAFYPELMMILWKLIQDNPKFVNYLLTVGGVLDVVVPILTFMCLGRRDISQVGLIHLGMFILLVLSGERAFCVALDQPFTPVMRLDIPSFTGTHVDLLYLVLHKLLVDAHEHVESLYDCMLCVCANVSPYARRLSLTTSLTLLKLFSALSRPKFVFARPNNHRFLFFLLETFNNLVQYQYAGNADFVYAIVQHRDAFARLARLQLATPSEVESNVSSQDETTVNAPSSEDSPSPPSVADVKAAAPATNGPRELDVHALASKPASAVAARPAQFVPTQEWFQSWKSQLPLNPCLRLLGAVVPNLPKVVAGSAGDEAKVKEYLAKTTLVGILPVPHPILIRRYQRNDATEKFFTSFLWGRIFVRLNRPAVFQGTQVRLFLLQIRSNAHPANMRRVESSPPAEQAPGASDATLAADSTQSSGSATGDETPNETETIADGENEPNNGGPEKKSSGGEEEEEEKTSTPPAQPPSSGSGWFGKVFG